LNTQQPTVSWYALKVRSNFEQRVDSALVGAGYETFLPLYKSRRTWSDRIKELNVPLFSGYTFCRLDAQYRLPVLKTPGVVSIVGMGKRPEPVPEEEIAAVRSIVETKLPAQPWPFLHVGQRIRVTKGPLSGVEGFLVEFKGKYRIVVSVRLLQRSVAAELDGAWVTPDQAVHSQQGHNIELASIHPSERPDAKSN